MKETDPPRMKPKRLRGMRRQRRMSQIAMAQRTGVSPAQYGRYERGENRISYEYEAKVERMFGGRK